jgi:DNA-directed RNA polymerase subunit beta'
MMFGTGESPPRARNRVVTLHTKIKGRFIAKDDEGNDVVEIHETTPGRMLLGELLPRKRGSSSIWSTSF